MTGALNSRLPFWEFRNGPPTSLGTEEVSFLLQSKKAPGSQRKKEENAPQGQGRHGDEKSSAVVKSKLCKSLAHLQVIVHQLLQKGQSERQAGIAGRQTY